MILGYFESLNSYFESLNSYFEQNNVELIEISVIDKVSLV